MIWLEAVVARAVGAVFRIAPAVVAARQIAANDDTRARMVARTLIAYSAGTMVVMAAVEVMVMAVAAVTMCDVATIAVRIGNGTTDDNARNACSDRGTCAIVRVGVVAPVRIRGCREAQAGHQRRC